LLIATDVPTDFLGKHGISVFELRKVAQTCVGKAAEEIFARGQKEKARADDP
jgi:hypothetical protein